MGERASNVEETETKSDQWRGWLGLAWLGFASFCLGVVDRGAGRGGKQQQQQRQHEQEEQQQGGPQPTRRGRPTHGARGCRLAVGGVPVLGHSGLWCLGWYVERIKWAFHSIESSRSVRPVQIQRRRGGLVSQPPVPNDAATSAGAVGARGAFEGRG